jgi:hypothetical protein
VPVVKTENTTVAAKSVALLPVSTAPMPTWVMQKNKTIAPVASMTINDQVVDVISECKPNDCVSDFMYTMTNDVNKQAFSLVVHVEDTNGAITEPSKYATYWYMGNPDTQVKRLLQRVLESNPNWK